MAATYYIILTDVGAAKIAASQSGGPAVNFATIRVGDSNGVYYEPTSAQTALVHQVWSGAITSITQDTLDPTTYTAEAVIPATTGGFFIREAGLFDTAGDMIAVGKYPLIQKTVVADGAGEDVAIRFLIKVSPTSNITVTIDPFTVYATVSYVDGVMASHLVAPNPHPQYESLVPRLTWKALFTIETNALTYSSVQPLTATTALLVYGTASGIFAKITTLTGETITFSGGITINTDVVISINMYSITATTFLVVWNVAGTIKTVVLTVSAGVITAGTIQTASTTAATTTAGDEYVRATMLTPTSGIIGYGKVTSNIPTGIGFTLSGTTLTFGAEISLSLVTTNVMINDGLKRMTDTTAVFSAGTRCAVITLTGTTLSRGTELTVSASSGVLFTADTFFVSCSVGSGSNKNIYIKYLVSGTTITSNKYLGVSEAEGGYLNSVLIGGLYFVDMYERNNILISGSYSADAVNISSNPTTSGLTAIAGSLPINNIASLSGYVITAGNSYDTGYASLSLVKVGL